MLGSSGFKTVSDLDRQGVRVAVEANTTTGRAAAGVLKLATVVAVPSVGEAIEMLRRGSVDAFALGREALVPYQADIQGSRILDGYFHRTGIAIAVPKSGQGALALVSTFLNEAKASGLIRRTFDKADLRSTAVACASGLARGPAVQLGALVPGGIGRALVQIQKTDGGEHARIHDTQVAAFASSRYRRRFAGRRHCNNGAGQRHHRLGRESNRRRYTDVQPRQHVALHGSTYDGDGPCRDV